MTCMQIWLLAQACLLIGAAVGYFCHIVVTNKRLLDRGLDPRDIFGD